MPQCSVRKSNSLPNLQRAIALSETLQQQQQQQREMEGEVEGNRNEQGEDQSGPLNVSQAISTSTMESCTSRSRNLLPMCQMPISISLSISERLQEDQQSEQHKEAMNTPTPQQQQQQQQQHHHHHHSHSHRHKHRCSCALSSTQGSQNFCSAASQAHISGSASSGNSNPAAFNLVKLFIKQKSSSSSTCAQEEAQACALTSMDVSSGCWPSSDAAGSSCSSSSLEKRLRKKSMNDSGKGSAVSRHDEEENYEDAGAEGASSTPKRQLRTRCNSVFYEDGASSSSTGSLTATNSPAHRRRSVPLRNPQLYQVAANTQTQMSTQCSEHSSEASNSEQLTQVPMGGKSRRPLSCASNSEMITRSMQTSCGSLSTTRSSLSERYKCVPPSASI